MTEFEYHDYIPANARIIVSYGKGEPVKFSYPVEWTYRKAVWKRAYPTITGFWLSIHLVPLVYIFIFGILPIFVGTVLAFPWHVMEGTTSVTTSVTTWADSMRILKLELTGISSLLVYLYLVPAVITYYLSLDKDRLARWMPKFGAWSAKIIGGFKEIEYTSKDVINNVVVLPSFNNVYLHYDANGDFEKYLEKVEVMEIPFNFKKRRFLYPFDSWKKQYNEWFFRVVFFFKQTPINGSMKVEFR